MEPKNAAVLLGFTHMLVLAALSIMCLAIHLVAKPFQRIFYCDDESIRYPLNEGTVPFSACIGAAVPLGVIVVTATEAIRHSCAPEKVKSGDNSRPMLLAVVSRLVPERISPPVAAAVAGLYQLVFTGLVNELFTVVGKMGFGRQRPHFLAACQLNDTCVAGRPYTPDFCRPTSASDFKNAQMSFPSGHSSFSMAVCVYLALYMQARLAFRHPMHAVKNAVQVGLVLLGASVAMSRVSDYKHHWSDILVGGAIGTACAALVALKFFAAGRRGGRGSGGSPVVSGGYRQAYVAESASSEAIGGGGGGPVRIA